MVGNISKISKKGSKGEDGVKGAKGDTPSVKFTYDADTGDLYCESDGVLLDHEYVASGNFATKAELEAISKALIELTNKVAPSPASITLYANKWQQDTIDTMWYQVVEVENASITQYSKVNLQLSAEQIATFYEKNLAFVAENAYGIVTVYCIGSVPEDDYTIQATISEVIVNG
jgi:hypothetical protein